MARKLTVEELQKMIESELGAPQDPAQMKVKSAPWNEAEPAGKIDWMKNLSIKEMFAHLREAPQTQGFILGRMGRGMSHPTFFAGDPNDAKKDTNKQDQAFVFPSKEAAEKASEDLMSSREAMGVPTEDMWYQIYPVGAKIGVRPSYPQ